MIMSINKIREYLPHRYPFLLIDRIVSYEPGASIEAYKNLTINESFFNGHFPGHPIFPGALLLEGMAQACGLLALLSAEETPKEDVTYYLAGTDKLRFKRPCVPGDQICFYVNFLNKRHGLWRFDAKAKVDDKIAASATILCSADVDL